MSIETILLPDSSGSVNHRQGKPPLLIRLRWWGIRVLAGRIPVMLNLEVSPHTQEECAYSSRVMHCTYGLFSGRIKAGPSTGITFKQIAGR